MGYTFVEESTWTHAATNYKLENNITDQDFPVMDFEKVLTQFVDDLAIFSPRTLPDNYKGMLTPIEYHLTALDSVLYALNRFGWLLSLRKSTALKDQFVYLGATWDMSEETIGINNDQLDSILS